ncbi:hypothetical protein LTS10_007958 [Elasticomyces elasticus]|nr:hypothetical protein LTS10_007958 [Elasticomyces elasticus]
MASESQANRTPAQFREEHRELLSQIMLNCYEDKEWSDFTIDYGGHSVRGHKCYFADASDFFRQAFWDAKAKGDMEPVITLTDDPETVRLMIYTVYHCGYSDAMDAWCSKDTLPTHRKMIAAGVKYQFHELKSAAELYCSVIIGEDFPEKDSRGVEVEEAASEVGHQSVDLVHRPRS